MTSAGHHVLGRRHQEHRDDFALAISDQLRTRYPFHTAKMVARQMGCSIKAAENLLAGHLSSRSINQLVRAFGLRLIVDAGAAMSGQTFKDFVLALADAAAAEKSNAEQQESAFRDLGGRLAARVRRATRLPPALVSRVATTMGIGQTRH